MNDMQKKGSIGKKNCVFSPRVMEKVNKMASKVKTLNICEVEPNWKWIYDDVILNHKDNSCDASPKFNQHWSY